jgi:hypothetical protein
MVRVKMLEFIFHNIFPRSFWGSIESIPKQLEHFFLEFLLEMFLVLLQLMDDSIMGFHMILNLNTLTDLLINQIFLSMR